MYFVQRFRKCVSKSCQICPKRPLKDRIHGFWYERRKVKGKLVVKYIGKFLTPEQAEIAAKPYGKKERRTSGKAVAVEAKQDLFAHLREKESALAIRRADRKAYWASPEGLAKKRKNRVGWLKKLADPKFIKKANDCREIRFLRKMLGVIPAEARKHEAERVAKARAELTSMGVKGYA